MFGIQFIKADPTVYLMQYRSGKLVRQGTGLSFFYFAPVTSLVAVPVGSMDIPFIFQEVTGDYQNVTIQGEAVYRIAEPVHIAQLLNFTLDPMSQEYVSEDPEKLSQRIISQIHVLVRDELQKLQLRDALHASERIVGTVKSALKDSPVFTALGIEVLDLSILAISPTTETARALEASVREELLKKADEAIYDRRNAAVEREREIKENELNTEIAVENKKRQIRETQMDAERAVQEKKQLLQEEEMAGKITLEDKNKTLVNLTVENARKEADARAYSISVVMEAVEKTDPKVLNALASVGMEPNKLIAMSLRELAESAVKIGELNISPDLLRELARTKGKAA